MSEEKITQFEKLVEFVSKVRQVQECKILDKALNRPQDLVSDPHFHDCRNQIFLLDRILDQAEEIQGNA